jgi:putative methionine-R-sulfoxide reductase with GAF domain
VAQSLTNSQPKVALNEASFQQLLAAASVMQQHRDRLLAKDPTASSTQALSEIAQAQKSIQSGNLNIAAASSLVAERLLISAKAAGVAIGLVEGDRLAYVAATGDAASQGGTRVPLDYGLSAECLLSGQIQKCTEAEFDPRVPFSFRRKGNIQSFIAVPIRHEEKVVGAIEVRFAQPQGFQEQDIRTCELMAGLLGEAISRPAKRNPPLEKFTGELTPFLTPEIFQPILDELVLDRKLDSEESGEGVTNNLSLNVERAGANDNGNDNEEGNGTDPNEWLAQQSLSIAQLAASKSVPAQADQNQQDDHDQISKDQINKETGFSPKSVDVPDPKMSTSVHCSCGHELTEQEAFCGSCGISRTSREADAGKSDPANSNEGYLQHKWATLWYMQEAVRRKESHNEQAGPERSAIASVPAQCDKRVSPPSVSVSARSGVTSPEVEADGVPPVPRSKQSLQEKRESPGGWFLAKSGKPEAKLNDTDSDGAGLDEEDFDEDAEWSTGDTFAAQNRSGERSDETALLISSDHSSATNSREHLPSDEQPLDHQLEDPEDLQVAATPAEDESTESTPKTWLLAQWQNHRAELYLAAAAILLVIAIVGLGAPATLNTKKNVNPATAQLTPLEKLLVATGLAEAPDVPQVYLGNPDTQVWLDVHTALYYCPGSALYGKTNAGRLASQRSAQQDRFDPENNRPCE